MNDIYKEKWIPLCGDLDRIHHDCRIGENVRIGEGTIIESGCRIGDNVFIGFNTVLRSGNTVGDNSIIGHLVMIESDSWIGKNTTIQSQCHITKYAKIDDHVFIGPKAMLINTHKISHGRDFEPELKGPHICFAARIGSGSIIMPGTVIGKNAVVGAGAVVTHDIPSEQIWFGNPARYQGEVPKKELLIK
jgi:acetyltransferase-like isoleucine patch superfamily enzyme